MINIYMHEYEQMSIIGSFLSSAVNLLDDQSLSSPGEPPGLPPLLPGGDPLPDLAGETLLDQHRTDPSWRTARNGACPLACRHQKIIIV